MSLNDFRNRVRLNLGERVQVDQRLLIDKILARYASENAIYRELMQNSDDAKSSSIQIIFEAANNNEMMGNKVEDRIIFKNNGFPFRPEDWDRLKRIAEGNPDEQKIGAFGVGFYSLFSICEEPFVSSGGQGMDFYWEENQLFVKQGPTDDNDKTWTTFLMVLREPIEFPDVEKFARFLANSLGFTENLQEVSVYFNDMLVIQLSKTTQDLRLKNISPMFDTFSPQKMFRLTSVNVRDVQLDIKRLLFPVNMNARQWCSLPIINFKTEEASIFFKIASGDLDVSVDFRTSEDMERITKKRPPRKTSIQMIFSGFDEYNSYISPIFEDLIPYPKQGKIYIGFPTNQTTGCCSHLAARVIPTMQRDSIDLAEKTLARYNNEMLSLAGTLCRILYEDEMAQITRSYKRYNINNLADTKDDENTKSARRFLEKWAAHALTHFTFNPSTPDVQVGKITESQFFKCSKQELHILSTNGVFPISSVRIPNPEMEGFIKEVPTVPTIIFEQCDIFFKKAKDMDLIKELTLQDVLVELERRILSEDEMVKLMKWWIFYRSGGNSVNESEFAQFMQLSRIGSRALNTFCYYLNPGIVPRDVNIPFEVLPYTISQNFKRNYNDLKKWFNWSELSLAVWANFIVNEPDLEINPTFAEKVHEILARGLRTMSSSDKATISRLFARKKCIPTRSGMKFPNETYLQTVNLFPDLPTIQFQRPLSVQNLMELFGVRKDVELEIIIERLVNQENCDYMQLIKYLASISSSLEASDIEILKNKPIWPKESLVNSQPTPISIIQYASAPIIQYPNRPIASAPIIQRRSRTFASAPIIQLFIISDLYVPLELHREFGLPVIDWKGRWSHNTQEGKFLIELGLREYPTLKRILSLTAPRYLLSFGSFRKDQDHKICDKALDYLISNFEEKYSKDYNPANINIAFLPCLDSNVYAKPSECFINPECKIMKFKVVRQDLQLYVEKLGVHQNPSRNELIDRLKKDPPRDRDKAIEVFEYLMSQQGNFIQTDWKTLADLEFIPIQNRTQPNAIILANSNSCFMEIPEEISNNFFSRVDFGEKANKFLECCGVKKEPYPLDLAKLLVKSSRELYDSVGHEKYLTILRRIAADFKYFRIISRKLSLTSEMKKKTILVAVKKKYPNSESNNDDKVYCLASTKEIFINDDILYQQIFNPLITPEEDVIESLYKTLGCRSLFDSVKETSVPRGAQETDKSQELQKTILERACLFYFKYSPVKVKRDENWLKTLKVKEVDHVETTYILENTRKIKKNDICIIQDKDSSWILYITSDAHLFDISKYIAKNIYNAYEWNDTFRVHALLTTPLPTLKSAGYPIDRIFQQPRNSNPNNVPPVVESVEGSLFATIRASIRETVTHKCNQNLPEVLQNAIKDCNSIGNSNTINSRTDFTNVNENQTSYCDIIPGNLLLYAGTRREIKLYDTKDGSKLGILSQSYTSPLNRFISILKDLANVFRFVTTEPIHIFYDEKSNSIAFNLNKALFFNLKTYIELHDEECKFKPTINAMTYWFMSFCHELAHNLVRVHSSEHEFYLASYARTYMPNLLSALKHNGLL